MAPKFAALIAAREGTEETALWAQIEPTLRRFKGQVSALDREAIRKGDISFHPRNPTRAIMDHVLDWKLIHRTEETMNRLFQASAFARPCTRILYEEQQINLFAECVKE